MDGSLHSAWMVVLHVPGKPDVPYVLMLGTRSPHLSAQIRSIQNFKRREADRVGLTSRWEKGLGDYMRLSETIRYCSVTPVSTQNGQCEKLPFDSLSCVEREHGPIDTWEHCENIWQLYRAIGYDRKRKRYEQEVAQ